MSDEHDDDHGAERLRAYVEAKQRNVDWPDAVRNSSRVDALLWKGSTRMTGIQRAGIWVFAVFFLFVSIGTALVAWEGRSAFVLLPAAFSFFIAARLIWNACRPNSSPDEEL